MFSTSRSSEELLLITVCVVAGSELRLISPVVTFWIACWMMGSPLGLIRSRSARSGCVLLGLLLDECDELIYLIFLIDLI